MEWSDRAYRRSVTGRARPTRGLTISLLAVLLLGAAPGAPSAVGASPASPQRRPSLLVITVDTLRADRLGAYGYLGVETPHMDRLAAEGVRFERAATTAPLTLPAHASIFTGRYPFRHGVRDNYASRLRPDAVTLAEILDSEGYATGGFVAAEVLAPETGIDQGYRTYTGPRRPAAAAAEPGEGLERRAGPVVEEALGWIGEQEGEFLAWVHLFDPHDPYEPPSPYRERHADRPYDGEVATVDAAVGRLLDGLDAAGLREETVVVLVADHGEGLGDHGERRHAFLAYESTLRVPLVIRAPGRLAAGRVVSEQVSVVDVLPTVLALLGVRDPAAGTRDGVDVGAPGAAAVRGPVYAEALSALLDFGWSELRVVYGDGYKLIDGADPELYRPATDPGEDDDLLDDQPGVVRSLRATLGSLVGDDDVGELHAADGSPGPERLDRLRSLGYLGGGAARTGEGLDPKRHVAVAETAVDLSQELLAAMDARDWPAAWGLVAELRELLPRHHMVEYQEGRLLLALGEAAAAAEILQEAVALGPGFLPAHVELARAHRRAGRPEAAVAVLEAAVRRFPDDPAPALLLGGYHHEDGRLDEALSAYLGARDIAPRHPRVLNNLAHLYMAREEPEAARRTLEELVRALPGDPDVWLPLGLVQLRLGDLAAAEGSLRRALDLAPDRADLRYALGLTLARAGDVREAARQFRRALQIEPDHAPARRALERLE